MTFDFKSFASMNLYCIRYIDDIWCTFRMAIFHFMGISVLHQIQQYIRSSHNKQTFLRKTVHCSLIFLFQRLPGLTHVNWVNKIVQCIFSFLKVANYKWLSNINFGSTLFVNLNNFAKNLLNYWWELAPILIAFVYLDHVLPPAQIFYHL